MTKTVKFLPKLQNFATSGHTQPLVREENMFYYRSQMTGATFGHSLNPFFHFLVFCLKMVLLAVADVADVADAASFKTKEKRTF